MKRNYPFHKPKPVFGIKRDRSAMPDQLSNIVELVVAREHKKQRALSRQAVARSRRLIAGAKETVQRSKEAQERAGASAKRFTERKAA